MGVINRIHLNFVLCLVGFVLLLFSFPQFWPLFLGPVHAPHFEGGYPFLDMHGRLAAFEAHRMGLDILHHPNPLDPLKRANVKPSWPLHLSFMGLSRAHLAVCGFVAAFAFLGVVASAVRPVKLHELAIALLIVLSPPILLGIERGNDDLVYFCLLALIIPLLKVEGTWKYWLIWAVIFILAPAKYYPGASFAVFLLEVKSLKRLLALFFAGIVFLGLYFANYYEELMYLKDEVPKPEGLVLFIHGSPTLFALIGMPAGVDKLFILFLCGLGFWAIMRKECLITLPSVASARWFVLGFSVFFFCYALNSNFDYRFVYLLILIPTFFEFIRSSDETGKMKTFGWLMLSLLLLISWTDNLFLHLGRMEDGGGSLEFSQLASIIKNILLAVFMVGATVTSASIIRPNLRMLYAEITSSKN